MRISGIEWFYFEIVSEKGQRERQSERETEKYQRERETEMKTRAAYMKDGVFELCDDSVDVLL